VACVNLYPPIYLFLPFSPNLITLVGGLFNLVPSIMLVYLYGSGISGELPPWFCIFLGVSFFLYSMCDNIDGKQARKTKSSSPLGMLFDHGIDAITAFINPFILARLLSLGNADMVTGMLITTIPFYHGTLEQYYTGELILQTVNGADDGSIVYIAFCFYTAYH
jgi:ethanolaminephosphotransferase